MIDLTKGVAISSQNIIDVLSMESPLFIDERDNKVEYARSFPNMMYTLWGYICTFRSFPSQRSFVSYYCLVHQEALKGYDETAIKARLLRAYPSLAREIHFFQLVRESNVFDHASYCAFNDIEGGIDFKVALGGNEYNILCYVQTQRSLWFHKKKDFRHKNPIINPIEMPLDLSKGTKIGNWCL